MNTITPFHNIQPISYTGSTTRRSAINSQSVDRVEKVGQKGLTEKSEKMLLTLLKSGITGEKPDPKVFEGATPLDWHKVLEMGNDSSTTAILTDGAKDLPKGTIPSSTLLEMLSGRSYTEKEHAKRVRIVTELSEKFAKKGVDTIHLKGVGCSMNYPEPNHRFGTDIDIFTRMKGHSTTTLSDAYNVADDLMIAEGREVGSYNNKYAKHSEFRYDGVEVDNHKYFIAKKQFPYAEKLDEYLHKNINPREQLLPNGKKILVPSKEFNSVFISHHAFQHHVIHELNLHHFVDWGMHVKENGLQLPEAAKGTKYEKFTYALTNLANRFLGTDVKVPEDKAYEDKLLKEILHPEWLDKPSENLNNFELFIYKTKRCFKNAQRIQELGGHNALYVFGKAAWNKVLHPTTLLVK